MDDEASSLALKHLVPKTVCTNTDANLMDLHLVFCSLLPLSQDDPTYEELQLPRLIPLKRLP